MAFTLAGARPLVTRLQRAGASAPKIMAATLYVTAEQVMAKSRPLVPVDEGTLRGSAMVEAPRVTPSGASIQFGYGGAASAYAWPQHEREDYAHTVGQAHFLSEPLEQVALARNFTMAI